MEYRDRVKASFEELLKRTGKTQTQAAELIGMSQQSLANKLSRGSLRFDDVLKFCDVMNIKPVWVDKDSFVTERTEMVIFPSSLSIEQRKLLGPSLAQQAFEKYGKKSEE